MKWWSKQDVQGTVVSGKDLSNVRILWRSTLKRRSGVSSVEHCSYKHSFIPKCRRRPAFVEFTYTLGSHIISFPRPEGMNSVPDLISAVTGLSRVCVRV